MAFAIPVSLLNVKNVLFVLIEARVKDHLVTGRSVVRYVLNIAIRYDYVLFILVKLPNT